MVGEAAVSFTGNLSQAPELRFTLAGVAVCNFSVAVQGRRKGPSGEYVDGDVSFYRCTAWRDFAENLTESLSVGDRVWVAGDLSVQTFTRKDETKGTSVEVDVSECGPSLRFATARPVKVRPSVAREPLAAVPAG